MTNPRSDLDRWFDGLESGDAPAPDAHFVRRLRSDLIAKANAMHTSSVAADPRPLAPVRRFGRRDWLQLAAVFALVFAWIGTLAGGGPNDIADRFGGFLRQDEPDESAVSMFRGNNARTGVIDETGPAANPYIAWEVTPEEAGFNIVNATDTIILLAYEQGGRFVALSRVDGSLLWKLDTECQFDEVTPAIVDGVVYVSSTCGSERTASFFAISESGGQQLWRTDTGEYSRSSPLIVDGTWYATTEGDTPSVLALSTEDGSLEWTKPIVRVDDPDAVLPDERLFGNASGFSPAYGDGMLFVTSYNGLIHAMDARTGEMRWSYDTGGNSVSTPAYDDGMLYLSFAGITMPNGSYGFLALDAENGEVAWSAELPTHSPRGGPVVQDDLIIFSLFDRPGNPETFAWDRESGELLWQQTTGGMMIDASGVLYLINPQSGYADALQSLTGAVIWSAYVDNFRFSDASEAMIISQPIVHDGAFFVSSAATKILVLEQATSLATPEEEADLDFTGLPACSPPPPVDWQSIDGEPSASLIPVGEHEQYGQPAAMFPDAVEVGEPVPQDVLDDLAESKKEMAACAGRPGQTDVTGFYSEDYYRRTWVKASLTRSEGYNLSFIVRGYLEAAALDTDRTTYWVTEDGRVAQLTMVNDDSDPVFGYLVVFVEIDNRWVIDEVIQVTPGAGGLG